MPLSISTIRFVKDVFLKDGTKVTLLHYASFASGYECGDFCGWSGSGKIFVEDFQCLGRILLAAVDQLVSLANFTDGID